MNISELNYDNISLKAIASIMNGKEYRKEEDKILEGMCKDVGVVIMYGASDDLCELRGAIHDEVGAYDGNKIYISPEGLLQNECDDDNCPYFNRLKQKSKSITPRRDHEGYSWTYETTIPHETFDIMEDGVKYCRGIVFALAHLKSWEEMRVEMEKAMQFIPDGQLVTMLPGKIGHTSPLKYRLTFKAKPDSDPEKPSFIIKYSSIEYPPVEQVAPLPIPDNETEEEKAIRMETDERNKPVVPEPIETDIIYEAVIASADELKAETIKLVLWLYDNKFINDRLEPIILDPNDNTDAKHS